MIEKTYIYKTEAYSSYQAIYTWFHANATDYFNSIVKDDTYNQINFYSNNRKILRIGINGSNPCSIQIVLYGLNDSKTISGNVRVNYIYKCEKGISFGVSDSLEDSRTNHKFILTITKDNQQNTVIIVAETLSINEPENVTSFYTINSATEALSKKGLYMNPNSEQTVLAPVLIGNTNNYTTDLFLMPYTQHTEAGIIEIDNIKYLSNGLWCVRAE